MRHPGLRCGKVARDYPVSRSSWRAETEAFVQQVGHDLVTSSC